MRSNTQTPLLQISRWFGIEPFSFNGIDYDGSGVGSYNDDTCECMKQHPWQTKTYFSRDDFIEMIRLSEEIFFQESNVCLSPIQILGEKHVFPKPTYRTSSYPCFIPRFSCQFKEFGIHSMHKIANIELVRENESGILDEFNFAFSLPDNYLCATKDQIHFYFIEEDRILNSQEDIKSFEIRPIEYVVVEDDGTVTGKAPAYLFKKPILDEEDDCQPHSLETYVESIDVYLMINDLTKQGNFYFPASNCQETPCDHINSPLCFNKIPIGNSLSEQIKGCPVAAYPEYDQLVLNDCFPKIKLKPYSLCGWPSYLEMNYMSGYDLISGKIRNDLFNAIIRMGIGLMDCVRDWCRCTACFQNKIEYWRSIERIKVAEGSKGGAIGDQWKELVSKNTLDQLSGLPPYRGITFGLRKIASIGCKNDGGGLFF